MSKEATQTTQAKRKPPFWLVVVGIALLGIITYNLTGDSSIGQLLFLILLVLVTFKVIWFMFRAGSLLLKILLVIFILIAWFGTLLSQSSMLSQ